MQPERVQRLKTPELPPSEYPYIGKVAPMLQVLFIRHMYMRRHGVDIKDVSRELRNQYMESWNDLNADIARNYFETHSNITVDVNNKEAVLDIFERIPLQEPDTLH